MVGHCWNDGIFRVGKCFCLYPEDSHLILENCPQILEANLAPTVLFLKRMELAGLGQCVFMDRPGSFASGNGTNPLFPQTEAGRRAGGCSGVLSGRGSPNEICLRSCLGPVSHDLAERTGPGCFCLHSDRRGQKGPAH